MDPSPQPGQPSGPTLLRQDLLKLPPPFRWEIPPPPNRSPKQASGHCQVHWTLGCPPPPAALLAGLRSILPLPHCLYPQWGQGLLSSLLSGLQRGGSGQKGQWASALRWMELPGPVGRAPHSWACTSSPFPRAGLFSRPLSRQCQGQPPSLLFHTHFRGL